MKKKGRHCLPVVLLLFGALEVAAQSDPKSEEAPVAAGPGQILFRAGFSPARANAPGGYTTYLRGVVANQDRIIEAFGVQAEMLPRPSLHVMVNYPRLRVDDIVPVFGRLYRVSELHDRGEPKGSKGKDWMVMTKVDEKTLPAGITFQEGSIGAPLSRDRAGGTAVGPHNNRIVLMKIDLAAADDKRGPVAEIKLFDSNKEPFETVLKLRRGDTLAIRDARYKVLNVVPRDEKTHVIGWIELAP